MLTMTFSPVKLTRRGGVLKLSHTPCVSDKGFDGRKTSKMKHTLLAACLLLYAILAFPTRVPAFQAGPEYEEEQAATTRVDDKTGTRFVVRKAERTTPYHNERERHRKGHKNCDHAQEEAPSFFAELFGMRRCW
ncbi:hypothetical protein Btru_042536 [Bulinus truncatus]|nr:hypothetical protein Btru_042536 [Bulinus truncatus]